MKVAYCSLLLPEEKKLSEKSKERLSGISLHKFTKAVISGLDSNLDEPVKIFNIINTLNYPKFPQIIFDTEKWNHTKGSEDYHIGYINIFGIKYMTQSVNLYKRLKNWEEDLDGEKNVICVHHIYLPSMQAAYWIKKRYKSQVHICLITGDMNGKYGLASQYKKNLKSRLTVYLEKRIDKLATKFDSYVFATEPMATAFKVSEKPHVVVECAYLEPNYKKNVSVMDSEKKILFYAGAIREEYGIPHLLRSFEMIESKNYELRIAGDGNCLPLLKKYAEKDSRIKYLGFITPQEVEENLNETTIIVSPRIASNYEFVKYSFPSKTMESLASGKPYIAHKLPCDPPEYDKYINYAADESDEALRNKIVEICNLPLDKRIEIGRNAREFVLQKKNPKIMTKKIVDMWDKYLY